MLFAVLLGALLPSLSACSLSPGSVILQVQQLDLDPKTDQHFKGIEIIVRNLGSSTARGITIRDRLPSGFSYLSTTSTSGDGIRTRTEDPSISSPSPTWAAWSLPAGTAKHPAELRLEFAVTVGRDPGKRPNFVDISSDDTDPVSPRPILLTVQPIPVLDITVTGKTPILTGQLATYTIRVRNTGTSAARSVFLSVALPDGFVYDGTQPIAGNALREFQTDPFPNSLLPAWGSWTIPPQQLDGSTGLLQLVFTARVLADTSPGIYPVSVTITFSGQPAQTVSGQAPITVVRGS